MSADRRTHMLLREIEGRRFILCDTKGSNLQSTRSFHELAEGLRCLRCVHRWNKFANLAKGDKEKMKSFLNLEVGDKYERLLNSH